MTGTELLSKTMRVIFATLGAFLFYCIGYMTLPWIAYAIREWRTLLAVLSMTSVVYIPLWWWVSSESIRVVTDMSISHLYLQLTFSILTWLQVHPGVSSLADHSGKSGGGRSHSERCSEEK